MEKALLTYYEIENTISEYKSEVSCACVTEEDAHREIKNYSDWWRPNGTGTIFRVDIFPRGNGLLRIQRIALGRYIEPGEFLRAR